MNINSFKKILNSDFIFVLCPPHWIKTPPLAPAFIKSYLDKYKIKSSVIDLNILLYHKLKKYKNIWQKCNNGFESGLYGLSKEYITPIIEYINKSSAEYVGFSVYDRNIYFVRKIIPEIKNKKIILGGPQLLRERKLRNYLNYADYIIYGEGEIPVKEIISEKSENKIFFYNEIENIDDIPFYDFDGLDIELYGNNIVLPLLASRGCLNKCRFCAEKLLYKRFRQHSPEYMAEQIKILIKKYNTNHFVFHDSAVNNDIDWLKKLCRLIIKNRINIKWEAQARIRNEMTADVFSIMKQAGCYNLFVGFESGSDSVLHRMNKGFNTDDAVEFFKAAYGSGLHYELSFIFDYYGETDETFKETLSFILKNKKYIPKIAQANPYIPDILIDTNTKDISSKRITEFKIFLKNNNIKFTNSFIGNLYEN